MARRSKKTRPHPDSLDTNAETIGVQQIHIPDILPILPVRDVVVFPGTVVPLSIGRAKSKKLLDEVLTGNKLLGVVAQHDANVNDPGPSDLFEVGAVAIALKLLRQNDGTENLVVHGLTRFELKTIKQRNPYLTGKLVLLSDDEKTSQELSALWLNVKQDAVKVIELSANAPQEAVTVLNNIERPGQLADFLAANLPLNFKQKQDLLETRNVTERLRKISVVLSHQLDVLQLSHKIRDQVKESIDKSQREYFLQEQMKAIQRELGQSEDGTADIEALAEKITAANLPAPANEQAHRELDRLRNIPIASPEYSVTRNYLEVLAELPWDVKTKDVLDLTRAQKTLDNDHYDLEKVKKRIIEFLAVRKLNPAGRGPILCFVGPPGVGKTSLGKSIAKRMGRKFIRVSLGGMRDEAEIRGHRRTYIGSMPGRVIQEMRKAGTNNPVFMLDEVDKLGTDFRGDPSSALLEVLDPQQNNTFTDHYLDVPFDLSSVMFIATANYMDPLPPALRDRMEIIEIPGYTQREKLFIAKKYLVRRQLKENGLTTKDLRFNDAALRAIIDGYTREAGVRNLERQIGAVARSVAAKVARRRGPGRTVKPQDLHRYLGSVMFERDLAARTSLPGVATGLAYTPYGGELIFVEATLMPGKGLLALTGHIGNVMKESAQAAHSLVRSKSEKLGIDAGRFIDTDIHIHVPAGAVPKDGPSAGVAIYTALASLLKGQSVFSDVAMTGEVTLRGLVLPIGGVKEKVLAARRAGIATVVLPNRNRKDLEDVNLKTLGDMKFKFVKNVDEVLAIALSKDNRKRRKKV